MNQDQKFLVNLYAPDSVLPPMLAFLCIEYAGLVFVGKYSMRFILYSCPIRRTIIKTRSLYKACL